MDGEVDRKPKAEFKDWRTRVAERTIAAQTSTAVSAVESKVRIAAARAEAGLIGGRGITVATVKSLIEVDQLIRANTDPNTDLELMCLEQMGRLGEISNHVAIEYLREISKGRNE